MDKLQRVLERQVRELAGGVLGEPQSSALDRSAEADMRGNSLGDGLLETHLGHGIWQTVDASSA